MRHFANALVFVPGGPADPALQYASRIAAGHGTRMTLADVLETAPAYLRPLLPREWHVPTLLREHQTARLEQAAARLRRLGVESRVRLLEGAPVKALVREVVGARHDLLIAAASGPGVLHASGTTTARLVRECPCPTLLTRPSRRRHRRVLVAIDPASGNRANAALNALLLETAIAVAGTAKADLHVLYAWEVYDERYLRRQGLKADEMTRFVTNARKAAEEAMRSAIAPYRHHLSARHVHLERGAPRKVIPAAVRKHGIELLVIGTVARAGLARHLLGNTAEVLLAEMPCSMLVVRPAKSRRRANAQGVRHA
jgi:universal stress protein E